MRKTPSPHTPNGPLRGARGGRQTRRSGVVWLVPRPLEAPATDQRMATAQVSGALALLPTAPADTEPSDALASHAASLAGEAPVCVLIVEDDPQVAAMLRHALELDGDPDWTIHTVADGGAALQKAREAAPRVVLLDVGLPGMDGPEVYQWLRSMPETQSARVIFLTGATSLDLSLRGVDGGVLLRKPYDVAQVVAFVQGVLSAED